MGCGCKKDKSNETIDSGEPINLGKNISHYFLKTLFFLVVLVFLPVFNVLIIWFIFRTLVLNKQIDLKSLLLAIGNSFKEKDDDEDIEDLTENDVVMLDVEEVKSPSK